MISGHYKETIIIDNRGGRASVLTDLLPIKAPVKCSALYILTKKSKPWHQSQRSSRNSTKHQTLRSLRAFQLESQSRSKQALVTTESPKRRQRSPRPHNRQRASKIRQVDGMTRAVPVIALGKLHFILYEAVH